MLPQKAYRDNKTGVTNILFRTVGGNMAQFIQYDKHYTTKEEQIPIMQKLVR
jgi:hypothetical protein